jgi:DNA-binding winged helix-turn-helix (wHTH) protein
VVSASLQRSLAAHVDPERPTGPPPVFDRGEMAQLRSEHPLAATLPLLRETLVAMADDAVHMMIVTDANGHILWREGHRGVLRKADEVGLVEGTRWSEDAIGTNAMGTALAANVAVQIHSAEHLVWTYHNWTCAACPVHDPDTGEIIGVVDVTGPVVGFHPTTAGLVNAAAKLAEGHLRGQMQARDERLRARCAPRLASLGAEYGALVTPSGRVLASQPHGWLPTPRLTLPPGRHAGDAPLVLADGRTAVLEPLAEGYLLRVPVARNSGSAATDATRPVLELRFLGGRPTATLAGRPVRLSQRHADMLTLLALHPEGVSAEQLATGVYGERGNPVTARAEIHRLRAHLNAVHATRTRRVEPVLHSGPYRLDAELAADFLTVRAALREGRVREAASTYRGELRPGSEAPAVLEERELLAATLRQAVLDTGDVEAMWLLAETTTGRDDIELAERLAAALPSADPRHATMTARATHLTT